MILLRFLIDNFGVLQRSDDEWTTICGFLDIDVSPTTYFVSDLPADADLWAFNVSMISGTLVALMID